MTKSLPTPAWIFYDAEGSALHDLATALREHAPAAFEVSLVPQASPAAAQRAPSSAQLAELARRLRSRSEPPAPRGDLSDVLTVFVTTIGAPSFDACLTLLRQQDCAFTLRILDRVAPLTAAHQRMLDECATPCFIPLDEDMLLYPGAIRSLHDALASAPDDVAMAVAELYDLHLDLPILGVKIFRHAIAARFPFHEELAFDVSQLDRVRAGGYAFHRVEQTLGLHGAYWTAAPIFARYALVERKQRARPDREGWFGAYPAEFLERFLRDPADPHFFALMGILAGVYMSQRGMTGEQDYRVDDARLGFHMVSRLLEGWRASGATPPERRPSGA